MKTGTAASVLLMTLLSFFAHAQLKGFSIGPYAESAWPRGSFSQNYNRGFGAGISADVKAGSKLSLLGSYGILYFSRNGANNEITSIAARPLRAGLKYKLPLLYLKMETGSAYLGKGLGSAPILSPGIGFRLLGLDVQGSYETWFRQGGIRFTSVKLAYHF